MLHLTQPTITVVREEQTMSEYQFTVTRQVVIVAHVSVAADSEGLARDLAMSGEFSGIEEGERREEFTLDILSLDAVEAD